MEREFSDNPEVHRELIVQDPPQEGRDVANFQRAIKERLIARGLDDEVSVPTHGKFTHATWVAAVEAGYFLGLQSSTYLATDKRRGLSTEGAQTIIRRPDKRNSDQFARARERQGQLERGPRYYSELAKKVAQPSGRGPEAALAFMKAHIGDHESPSGSNWGRPVQDWIHLAGYNSPVPWCGCFANAAIVAAGVPNGAGWIGYTPAIIQHAQRGIGGWSWHSEGQPGDLVLFDTPGGDPAVHVGMVVRKVGNGHYITREGNTSSGSSGSQDHGGTCAERDRVSTPAFRIVGFARPPYKS